MSTAQLAAHLTEQPPSKLYSLLKKQSVESLAAVSDHDPLDQFNPAFHSLQYLFILRSRLLRPAKTDTEGSLIQKIAFFLECFDPQRVKVAAFEFHNLVSEFASLCDVQLNSPVLALASMKIAIHRYSKSHSHLTSIHYLFIRQCLLARCYDEALGILDMVIDDLDLDTELSYQHYLLYFYYGCMVYIALKDFQRAHDFALLVITAPGSACSAIQLEAYKKYILISVILNGKISSIPSTVSQAAARAFKHLARPYEEFAQAVRKQDAVQDCLRTHEAVFAEDKNLGLVSQALERQEMRQIAALKETYVTISLQDIATKVCGAKSNISSDDVQRMESLILRMIEDKVLNARISDSPPVVTFSDDIEVPTRHQLETILSLTSSINNKIKALDREVSLSTAYNTKQSNKSGQGRMSPVEGEPEVNSRYSMRSLEQGKTGRGRKGSISRGGNKFPVSLDEKMED